MRYFIIFYIGLHEDGGGTVGSYSAIQKGYLNRAYTVQLIKDYRQLTDCTITGINEITESDYNDWHGIKVP